MIICWVGTRRKLEQGPLQAVSGDARSGVSDRCQEALSERKENEALGRWRSLQGAVGASFLELLSLSSKEKTATVSLLSLETSLLNQREKVAEHHKIIDWAELKGSERLSSSTPDRKQVNDLPGQNHNAAARVPTRCCLGKAVPPLRAYSLGAEERKAVSAAAVLGIAMRCTGSACMSPIDVFCFLCFFFKNKHLKICLLC